MKKVFFHLASVLLAASLLTGCQAWQAKRIAKDSASVTEELHAILADTTLTDSAQTVAYVQVLEKTFLHHTNDSLGLWTLQMCLANLDDTTHSVALYNQAAEWIQQNNRTQGLITAIRNRVNTLPGKPYIEVCGVDAITGESVCLSQLISGTQPVLLDFWASWCSPCRREIRNHLLDLQAQGTVQIIGIAVWEDTIADTQKAIRDLGITWPVIYTNGRANSPSQVYGITGIPTLFMLRPDGTFQSSGHSLEEL